MIFKLDLEHALTPTEMVMEELYLKKSTVFGGGPPFAGTQRLVKCFRAEWEYFLVRDMDSGKVTAVNRDELEGYVLVDEALVEVVAGVVREEKDKRLEAFQRASQVMDELEAI